MSLDPECVGARSPARLVTWTDRDTLLYAVGIGAGTSDLELTTENSLGVQQKVLPTFAATIATVAEVASRMGKVDWGSAVHASQEVRVERPLMPSGALVVQSHIASAVDKGAGNHAIVTIISTAIDPESEQSVAEATSILIFRGQGGFGGFDSPTTLPREVPSVEPDHIATDVIDARQALIYRLSGDRNPIHSDPAYARKRGGFERPILHGLCTYGIASRAIVRVLANGDPESLARVGAHFTAPTYPGDTLTTEIWRTSAGAAFRCRAEGTPGTSRRVVLDFGTADFFSGLS